VVEGLDRSGVERLVIANLEAVVLGGVVAGGDHHAGVGRVQVGGEVVHRRRHHAQVGDDQAGVAQRCAQRPADARGAQPRVAADDDDPPAALQHVSAHGPANRADDRVGQLAVSQAADAIAPKQMRINVGFFG